MDWIAKGPIWQHWHLTQMTREATMPSIILDCTS